MRPAPEPLLVLSRDTQHVADDDERQRVGEVGDDVDLALAGHGPHELVGQLLGPGRSCSMLRGVNALDTRPRSRVWSGGSMNRNGPPVGHLGIDVAGVDKGVERLGLGVVAAPVRVAQQRARHRRTGVITRKPSGLSCTGSSAREPRVGGIRVLLELRIERVERERQFFLSCGHASDPTPAVTRFVCDAPSRSCGDDGHGFGQADAHWSMSSSLMTSGRAEGDGVGADGAGDHAARRACSSRTSMASTPLAEHHRPHGARRRARW